MQRAYGNRAVQRMLVSSARPTPPSTNYSAPVIQATLTVGPVDDPYEREADSVASKVMSLGSVGAGSWNAGEPGGNKAVQRKPLSAAITPLVQRHAMPPKKGVEDEEEKQLEDEEETGVQRKATAPGMAGFQADESVEQRLAANRGAGQPLTDGLRGNMEGRFGADFSQVRVHTGPQAVQLNRELSAQAFTHGSNIYFGAGNYNPATNGGQHLLAHELTHVVQQTGPGPAASRVQRKPPVFKAAQARIQRAPEKNKKQKAWDWFKRVVVGVPAGIVLGIAGLLAGPFMGAAKGIREAKETGQSKILGGIGGFFGGAVGGLGAGLYAGQKIAVHDPDEGDVPWGEELPTVPEMAKDLVGSRKKKEEKLTKNTIENETARRMDTLMIPTALIKIDDDEFMAGVLNTVTSRMKKTVDDTMFGTVRSTVKAQLNGATDLEEAMRTAKDIVKVKQGSTDTLAGARVYLINEFKTLVENHVRSLAGQTPINLPMPMFPEDVAFTSATDEDTGAQAFLQEREKYEMTHAYVPNEERKPFADALKTLDTVKFILNPQEEGVEGRTSGGVWQDGGNLHDESNLLPVNDLARPKKFLAERRLKSRTFRRKVAAADKLTRIVVGPDLLARIKKPKIAIHSTAALDIDAPWGFRAYQGGNEVHVSYNEAGSTIAHEVGHAIERHLPLERWHDVHMLMGARHEAAGGGGAKAGATPFFTHWTEGRFGGKYVTGKYTSRTYKWANFAEVISMAMEYFATPSNARELIEGDPQHAAIVLRSLRPDEYDQNNSLKRFNKYIPHKKAPPVPPKPSAQVMQAIMRRVEKMKQNKQQPLETENNQ